MRLSELRQVAEFTVSDRLAYVRSPVQDRELRFLGGLGPLLAYSPVTLSSRPRLTRHVQRF